MKRVSVLVLMLALALLVAPQASADPYVLTDRNATLSVSATSQAGAYNWITDGIDALFQQWFWYRIGNTAEQSIDQLNLISATQSSPNELLLNYGSVNSAGAPNGLQIEVDYVLHGGATGTFTSDVAETITINNNGTAPLDLHFFQYSDFDLNRINLADMVVVDPSRLFVDQVPFEGGSQSPIVSETVVTPRPNHAEANFFANTLNSLNDGSPTTLNDVLTAGPGDVTWAFQWDRTLAAGGSFIISKDKNLAPAVPEPATLGLLGGVLFVLARKFRTYMA